MFEVNYFGAIALTKAFLELIREHKGRIINVTSLAAFTGRGSLSAYASTKFALQGFSDSLRKELNPLGVAVSTVNPGYIVTKMFDKASVSIDASLPHIPAKWIALYGRYFNGAKERYTRYFIKGESTDTTSNAIKHAAFSPHPKARYLLSNNDGVPAWINHLLVSALPPYTFDAFDELEYNK